MGELFEVAVNTAAVVNATVNTRAPVHFVVPDAIDDAARVSGGNVYDRHVRDGLRSRGWDVRMLVIEQAQTNPSADGSATALAPATPAPTALALAALPDGALVLIDGLIAVAESDAVVAEASRLRMLVLAHMVWGPSEAADHDDQAIASIDRERAALRAAKRVIATSEWTRSELTSRGLTAPGTVVVARPGTDPAPAAVASRSGGRMLCLGVVAPHKGQDILVHALARLTDLADWTCTIAGALNTAPHFVHELTSALQTSRLTPRVTLTGALAGASLERAYGSADLVIVPSRDESFGMVVAEALARGIPVVASWVGGVPEAMAGSSAGVLVPADDPWALEVVLRQWLTDPERRAELKAAAMDARPAARPWSATVAVVASALESVLSETVHTDHERANQTAASA
ncbi:MAG TPA: glycosyltransferase family 4 protein [Microbacteriaceae bacterium]|nr:glycosyltransferase family 4 protein [Microbacteriaceae bacterium]